MFTTILSNNFAYSTFIAWDNYVYYGDYLLYTPYDEYDSEDEARAYEDEMWELERCMETRLPELRCRAAE